MQLLRERVQWLLKEVAAKHYHSRRQYYMTAYDQLHTLSEFIPWERFLISTGFGD